MAPKLCPDCLTHHHLHQAHVWPATNKVTATNANATNTTSGSRAAVHHKVGGKASVGVEHEGRSAPEGEIGRPSKTKNRRDRKAYNAYQREYVKRWRARKKSEQH